MAEARRPVLAGFCVAASGGDAFADSRDRNRSRNGRSSSVLSKTKTNRVFRAVSKLNESPPADHVVLVKDTTADAGAPGFNAPYGPLLVTLALAGLFAIGYFIFG